MKNNYKSFSSLLLLFFSFLFLLNISLYSQAIDDYRSAANGNWNTLATWERYNGTSWVTPTGTPTSSNGVITILNGHTVTIATGGRTVDQMIINSGGQVTINSPHTFTIADGIGTDLTVNGILVNSGTVAVISGAAVSFGSGSTYRHAKNAGTIPTATWATTSTCSITGVIGTIPTGMGQAFGNLTWNCTGQTINNTNLGNLFTVNGNFAIASTGGSGILRLATGTTTINGNYSQTGGSIRIGGNSARIISVGGNFSISAGTFLLADGTNTGTLNVAGNFSNSVGTFRMSSNSGIGTLNVSGNFSFTSGTIDENSSGSGLVVFDGASNQSVTGGGAILNTINFVINNPAGITLLTSVTFPAALTMTTGNIALNGFTLTLGTGSTTATKGTLNWTSGYMTGAGTFTRWFDNSTAITIGTNAGLFPMGNGTDNRSVWFGGTPSAGGTLSVQHSNQTGVTDLTSFTDGGILVNRRHNMFWTLSPANGFNDTNGLLRIQGTGITGITAFAELRLIRATDAVGTSSNGTGSNLNPQVNRTLLTGANYNNTFYFGSNSGVNPLPVELSSFSATVLENGVKLNWRTETEVNNYGFEILRSAQNDQWELLGFVEGNGNSNSPKHYSFIDGNVIAGKYSYRLKQIDNDGKFEYSKIVEVNVGTPLNFELSQNYPNPFNPATTINFSLPENEFVNLSVYNVLGEKVASLLNETKEAGVYSINFSAAAGLNSGIYFYKLETSNFTQIRKMMLVK